LFNFGVEVERECELVLQAGVRKGTRLRSDSDSRCTRDSVESHLVELDRHSNEKKRVSMFWREKVVHGETKKDRRDVVSSESGRLWGSFSF